MSPKNEHKRILLKQNKSGKVEYCEGCDVVEMEIGPVSVRLHAQDLSLFSSLIHDAEMQLRYCQWKQDAEEEVLDTGFMH